MLDELNRREREIYAFAAQVISIKIKLIGVVEDRGSRASLHWRVRLRKSDTANVRGPADDMPDFRESLGIVQARAIERKLELSVHQ
jgi:hypothetical protein